ncbi:MAG: purine-nucleoside phosphorylase [Paracoccaceae bacterium]|nr:purine-nucleoside phosphorylase [Paracoccaceae bacterium]
MTLSADERVAQVSKARSVLEDMISDPLEATLILGSGLGGLVETIKPENVMEYRQIPGFAISTAPSHAGRLIIGELGGRRVGIMQGRMHLYEGWSPIDIALPIRVLRTLGATRLVVTNAAGALNTDFDPGDVMQISDHINLTGQNPLIGPHDDRLGLRFPDMSDAYDSRIQAICQSCFNNDGIPLQRGIYAGITGPSLETSAERRFIRQLGGDVVGMSTVMEVIAAKQAGFEVAGLSAITNKADGGADQQPDTIEEVLAYSAVAGDKILRVLPSLLRAWDQDKKADPA